MMLSRNVHGDPRIFYTSTIHHQFRTLAFYHPKPSKKTIQNHPTPRFPMVFPWFFLVFTLETARCGKPHHFPNGFPHQPGQIGSATQTWRTAPGGFQAWKKCMFASKKHHSIYSIVKYIYIYSSYWFHIDFTLISYYITVSQHGSLVWNYMKLQKHTKAN